MDPKGKVALVTGGANGLGLAITEQLLLEGVKGVSICDVNTQLGEQRVSELQANHGEARVTFIQMDVRDYKQFEDAFKGTKEKYGKLDIVVNNAGIFDDIQWEKEVDINLNGVIRGILLSFDHMGKRSGSEEPAVLVNISSISGLEPFDTFPIYSGIKHAVVGLSRAFGTERHFERTGVRVAAICPGFTHSNIGIGGKGMIDNSWLSTLREEQRQTPDYVGRGVLKIIREAPNGSVWISEHEKEAYQVTIPPRLSLRTVQPTCK